MAHYQKAMLDVTVDNHGSIWLVRQDFEQKALERFSAKRDTANVEVLVTVDEALADLQREHEHDLRAVEA
jgi:hypothetical protein